MIRRYSPNTESCCENFFSSPPRRVLVGITFCAADSKPARKPGTKWDLMEHGPFLSSYLDASPKINKAVSINLGNGATVCFDTEMCKLALGWQGGFVRLPAGRDGLEGMPRPDLTNIVFTTPAGPGWADAEGNFSDNRPVFKGRKYGPLPKEHAKWRGIYLDGNTAVLNYTVGRARILEKPAFENGEWTRTFQVEDADQPLTVVLFRGTKPVVKGGMFPSPKPLGGGAHATFETDAQAGYIAVTGTLDVKQVHVITTNDVVALRLDVPRSGSFRIAMAFGTKEHAPRTPRQEPVGDLSRFTKRRRTALGRTDVGPRQTQHEHG